MSSIFLSVKHFFTSDPDPKKGITDFKKDYEKNIAKIEPNILQKMASQNIPSNCTLSDHLISLSTYVESQEKVVAVVYTALHNLLEKPASNDHIASAKSVYKKLSTFLRNQTDKKFLKNYQDFITNKSFLELGHGEQPSAYLVKSLGNNAITEERHCALLYLLKNLRKQIKLVDKQDKISARVKDIPEELCSKALPYLNLTWMHGTKAFVIKSACEKTNGELLPSGELRKRNIQILTGEMKRGATSVGINKNSISGVNLVHAAGSISYADNFSLKIEDELKNYKALLSKDFSGGCLENYLEHEGSFQRSLVALRRIQIYKPEVFHQDKELLEKKVEEIYKGLKSDIFDKRPKKIFEKNYFGNSYPCEFYTFLKCFEEFEELIKTPPKIEPKDPFDEELAKIGVVVASATRYGIPSSLSTFREHSEEDLFGTMGLGKDIRVIFAHDKDIQTVAMLLSNFGLESSVKVESMEVLSAASKIDQELGAYFYDVYNLEKWQRQLFSVF